MLEPLELELQAVVSHIEYRCWELKSGPLEEQEAVLITELSLQPNLFFDIFIRAYSVSGPVCAVRTPSLKLSRRPTLFPLQHGSLSTPHPLLIF